MRGVEKVSFLRDAGWSGASPHYLILHQFVLGLEATRVLEFGSGGSTAAILAALEETHGVLDVIDVPDSWTPETKDRFASLGFGANEVRRHEREGRLRWHYGQSDDVRRNDIALSLHAGYDLVFHDGSHDSRVARDDILFALGFLKQFGLVLIHDTQHPVHGAAMRNAVAEAVDIAGKPAMGGHSMTTLPFGYGLTIIRREGASLFGSVAPTRSKCGSETRTEPHEFVYPVIV